MSIFITFIALSIVVFIHECGHLIAAKRSGIGASHFSVGFGPIILGKQWKDTHYSLRLLPFGGFVRLAGLDDDTDYDDNPNSFYNASLPRRFLTISAGSLANIILGFLLFFIVFLGIGNLSPTPEIERVLPNSPAQLSGLMAGDRITHVNGQALVDIERDVIHLVANGQPITLQLARGTETLTTTLTPQQLPNQATLKLGIGFRIHKEPATLLTALSGASEATWASVKEVFLGIKLLITGTVSMKEMAGPIGIVQFASFGLHVGLLSFLSIMAKISISLGVINLFPFPMLDGGHNLILAIEAIRKKRLSKRVELMVQQVGAICIITLMVLIVTNDVLSWGSRHDLLQTLLN